MTLKRLVTLAADKTNFETLDAYIDFASRYLDFLDGGVQATIVSQNENQYQFFQYKKNGHFNITRPINSDLMYDASSASEVTIDFLKTIDAARSIPPDNIDARSRIRNSIYTIQQSIGAALDALPAGESNRARKVNGDLFERLILLLLQRLKIPCKSGTVRVPVIVDGKELFKMNYQHDLIVQNGEFVDAIGSVKTSSKDRIDKIFMDKFLYNRITDTDTPHFAVFLNDVQRKNVKAENKYGISATFLPGHFKGYTVKLNPLDGVFYCDIRPNMRSDELLSKHIDTIDVLFCSAIWKMYDETSPADNKSKPKVVVKKD